MKKISLLTGVFFIVSGITTGGVIAAQSGGAQADKQKPAAKSTAAKAHTMTGCLEKGTDDKTFRLTNVEGTGPKTAELHADAKLKLSAHVGHKVAITGTNIDPKTMKTETAAKPGAETPTGTSGEHHMRVRSFKHISPTCS